MSPPRSPQIIALGGLGGEAETRALVEYVLHATGVQHPRVCFLPTAAADAAEAVVAFYETFSGRAEPRHATLFPWPPPDLRERVLSADAVWVGGGNTANMLAVWRAHGVDELLREAWEQGTVLAGWSAGMICWFEAGVTDSFGPELSGLRDGLGFLPGSGCPHYDAEERRRPVYRSLVRDGFPPGYAADDDAGLHFLGTGLHEVISARAGALAYRVDAEGETPLRARELTRS
jgi:dipeptidase E